MKDYKIQVEDAHDVLLILDKAPLLGYHLDNIKDKKHILQAKYILICSLQGVRWCEKKQYEDCHADYQEMELKEFLGLC